MGAFATQPKEIQSQNLISDFEFRMFHPNRSGNVSIKTGPSANLMSAENSNEIHMCIQNILKNGDPYNASLHRKYSTLYCCCNIPFILCLFLLPIGVFYFVVFGTSTDDLIWGDYVYPALGVIAVLVCIVCYCYCCTAQNATKTAEMWRTNIIQKIGDQREVWQAQWPQYTLTIIYPLLTYGRRRKNGGRPIVDIRAILRVTKVIGHNIMPIYQPEVQYRGQQAPSEMLALNVQQPQVMIQGANGQPMVVQGKKAIVNGREVLLVEQPANMQQLQVHHQQQQQQQHIVPVMSHENSANVPLSTEQGGYHNASAPEADAPPAYNPVASYDHEENEGGGATFS